MPRTKIVKKRRASQEPANPNDETLNISQEKKKDIHQKIQEFEECIEAAKCNARINHSKVLLNIKNFYTTIDSLISEKGIGNLTIKQLSEFGHGNDENRIFENVQLPKQKSTAERSNRKRSNSCATRSTASKTQQIRSISCERANHIIYKSTSKMKTPLNQQIPSIPFVTPKVNPNQPMAILRRPKMGEFAVSMSGSPLMVSSVSHDDMVSVSIPLPDGRILSILPTEGIDAADLTLDEGTRAQLKKLRQNLTKCLQK